MQLNAKDFSLPLKKVQETCPEIQKFVNSKGKIDLGDSQALYQYNKYLFKILDGIIIDLENATDNFVNLIPTAGLRRLIASVLIKQLSPKKVIEVGTGSTAILALLLAKNNIHVIATEINPRSFISAQNHVSANKLQEYITLVKSEGGILQYLEKYFPVDCVLSLPPYYADETRSQTRKRGFKGIDSELYSFGESADFSLKLINEWNDIDSIPSICILWKNTEDMEKGLLTQKELKREIKTFEIIAGTRKRYLTIMRKQ